MSEEATAIAATLRACVREGDEYEAISRIGLRAADMLERQAAQLAALRAGADTEDLHAAPKQNAGLSRLMKAQAAAVAELDAAQAASWLEHEAARVDAADRIVALEAEAETLHAAAEGWRKRAEAADAKLTGPLPCDVRIPGALIGAGVKIETLLLAISRREPGTKLPERKPAVSWDAVAEARRQALEEAEQAAAKELCRLVDAGGVTTAGRYWIHASGKGISAAIRALADKPAAGGEA